MTQAEPDRIAFTVPGLASGKARPRIVRAGSGVRAFTPEKTVLRENLVAWAFRQAFPGRIPHDGPVSLSVTATYAMPRSWSARKKARMDGRLKTTKPDLDNVVKAVSDGLNRVAWTDDARVAESAERKVWGWVDETVVVLALHGESGG